MDEQPMTARGYATFPRRLYALVIDTGVFILLLVAGMVVVGLTGTQAGGIAFLVSILAFGFLYEPILVSRTGGTVGHHLGNLRVARADDDARLGFLRATARAWLKAILGVFSFFFMALTRRHQALHDLATRSVVVVQDIERAAPTHYTLERSEDPGRVSVSRTRRVLVIAVYWVAAWLVLSIADVLLVSNACLTTRSCSPGEHLVSEATGYGIFLCWGVSLVLGWTGRLPGARGRPTAADTTGGTDS